MKTCCNERFAAGFLFIESFRYCYRVKIEVQTKAPLVKGGWFGEAKPGGYPGTAWVLLP